MGLSFVTADDSDSPTSNFVLYGPPGVGKTTGLGTAPGPVLFLNAEGSNRARFARRMHGDKFAEVEVTGKAVLREVMLAVKEDTKSGRPKTWPTVGVDTAGEVYRVLVDEAAGGGSAMPQVQHYGEAGKTFERFCRFMRDMPVNFVVISHEELTDGPDGPLLMPGGFGNKLPPKLCGWVDYVGYVGVIPASEGDSGPDRHVAQFISGNNRYAKNSESVLPKVADLDITSWLAAIAAAGKDGR